MRISFAVPQVGFVSLAVAVLACQQPPAPPTEAPDGPLEGAWQVTTFELADSSVVDPAQPGLFIFTKGYYSAVYTNRAEPRVPAETHFSPTEEETLDQYQSLIVNAGTYTVGGSGVTFRPLVAKSPAFIGGEATAEFSIAGDVLTLEYSTIFSTDGTSAPNVRGVITLRRVE